ncbi:MAG: hypothetical protein RLY58_1631 [Pseudomonadota bacterium]|jgi:hypothetical protein
MAINMDDHIQRDSNSWLFFVKVSFALSMAAMLAGIFFMPVDWWIKGYLVMGTLFLTGSTITMTKTIRDQSEADKLIKKISNAKTERLLKEYELNDK